MQRHEWRWECTADARINHTNATRNNCIIVNYIIVSRIFLCSSRAFVPIKNPQSSSDKSEKSIAFHFTLWERLVRTTLNFLLSEGKMESATLMYAERDAADDFEFAFLRVKLEPAGRGLLIRNEKTTGFLVSRHSVNAKSCLPPVKLFYLQLVISKFRSIHDKI